MCDGSCIRFVAVVHMTDEAGRAYPPYLQQAHCLIPNKQVRSGRNYESLRLFNSAK